MATWNEVQQKIRGSFVLDQDLDHEFVLTLEITRERHQRVMVRHYEALDAELVEVRSAFAQGNEVPAEQILDENLTLPYGAIARHGRYLVVVQRVSLGTTTVEGVITAVTRVARVADWLESRHGGDRF